MADEAQARRRHDVLLHLARCKLGGGLGTAITGWLLAFSNYDKALAVQPDSCINMLKLMYLVIPFVLDAIITFILSRMKVEEANDKIRAEMKN